MVEIVRELFRFVAPHILDVVRGGSSADVERFLRDVEPILADMYAQAEIQNLGQLPPEFRAPFERRILALKQSVGGGGRS